MEDLISQLPDELLQVILLNVSMRDSVRTSVLSSRWRNLWKGVPGLHLVGHHVWTKLGFKDFLERFLNLHKESPPPIYQFTLWCSDKDHDFFDEYWFEWLIDKVITRGVQCFAIDGCMYKRAVLCMIKLPVRLYKCETLVHLFLNHVDMDGFEFFYLPRLETMHLVSVSFSSEVVLEKLILCSPVLQVLKIYDTTLGHLTLRSQTIKSLSVRRCFHPRAFWRSSDGGEFEVVIDIPSLEILCIRNDLLENFRLESVSSSIKMCIDVRSFAKEKNIWTIVKDNMSRMQAFRNFFARFSDVTELTLSGYTLEGLYLDHSQPQQLPNFKNLTHLNACFYSGFSDMLPMFLSSCPNLKSLDLWLHGYPNTKKIANSPVPRCFHTSIEYVEVKMTPGAGQERSRRAEINFAKYILKNATILKKLTLWLDGEEEESSTVLQRILTFQNRSFVEVKMNQSPAKFQMGYGFEAKPFFDPIASFYLPFLKYFWS